jgi:protease PrsW
MKTQILIMFYVFTVILPTIFWIWFFRSLDKKDPEPKKLLFKVFRFGFGALLLAFFVELAIDRTFFFDSLQLMELNLDAALKGKDLIFVLLSFFLAGPIEELLKYLALKWAIFKNREFNQIADGIVYGTVLGLGFAFIENTGYFFDSFATLNTAGFVAVMTVRGVMTTMLHVLATGIVGLFVARSKFIAKEHQFGVYKGVLIASLLHGLYNVLAFSVLGMVANVGLIFFAAAYLVKEIKKQEVQRVWRI